MARRAPRFSLTGGGEQHHGEQPAEASAAVSTAPVNDERKKYFADCLAKPKIVVTFAPANLRDLWQISGSPRWKDG